MYQIFADDTLIYDSTLEDFKIGKGQISLETNKSGSFVFSVYPEHFFYDEFIKLKTVITVYKSGRIVFRGRILNDVTDYWNNKVITCEGELGFLQDSIIRPFEFTGTPEELFIQFIQTHNAQVDEFKRFNIGTCTVVDANDYIARSNSAYETPLTNLNSRLLETLGGYIYVTHGDDGTDITPTIHYLADFETVSTQNIEFGANLKDYTKTVKAEEIGTAIIPLGAEVDDNDDSTENPKLTIEAVNNGVDYVYNSEAVALYGWIFKVVEWQDVTEASNLKAKAEAYLQSLVMQNVTIELNAIDLHLLDKDIESFRVGDYIRVISTPHNFDSTLLCNKQTIDLLKPENDTVTLGYTYSSFTETATKASSTASKATQNVQSSVGKVNTDLLDLKASVAKLSSDFENFKSYADDSDTVLSGDIEELASDIESLENTVNSLSTSINTISNNVTTLSSKVSSLYLKTKTVNITSFSFTKSSDGIYYMSVNTLYNLGLNGKTIGGIYISGMAGLTATSLILPAIVGDELVLLATASLTPTSLSVTISYW